MYKKLLIALDAFREEIDFLIINFRYE